MNQPFRAPPSPPARSIRRPFSRSFSLLTGAMLVGGAFGLFHCSSGGGGDATGAASSRLRFTYDEGTKAIGVFSSLDLSDGSLVYVRARRGNLTPTSPDEVDCAKVAATPGALVETSAGTPTGSRGEIAYRGPSVKDVPLTEFFDDNVILDNPTPDQVADMNVGVNSVVEGCVMKGGVVVEKAQMSLLRAWDDATPDLLTKAAAADDGTAKTAPPIHAVSTYGALCEQELGPIPFFPKNSDGTYGTYDCTSEDAVEVPITVTDNGGKAQTMTTTPDACDRPDWLRTSCSPYARVNSATNAQGTRWVIICRGMGKKHTAKTTVFNDIALIGHDPKSGKSCFVQNALYFKNDGAHVPSPADPKHAENLWASFKGDACNSCHDADPWIHSPWLDQAKTKDGKHVVPYIGEDPGYPLGQSAPYRIVGAVSNGWAQRRHLTSPEAQACTSCHRIAEGAGMFGESLDDSGSSWTARTLGQDKGYFGSVTASYQAFARSHTMPPSLGNLTETTWPSSPMGKAASFILGCSDAKTCKFSEIPLR